MKIKWIPSLKSSLMVELGLVRQEHHTVHHHHARGAP